MTILLVLIPVTLLFVILGGIAFFWAVNHDQFDDMETPALEPLADSEPDLAQDVRRDVHQ
jgi:cbb3-type cytochrome oxidase maturation protein